MCAQQTCAQAVLMLIFDVCTHTNMNGRRHLNIAAQQEGSNKSNMQAFKPHVIIFMGQFWIITRAYKAQSIY